VFNNPAKSDTVIVSHRNLTIYLVLLGDLHSRETLELIQAITTGGETEQTPPPHGQLSRSL
jgi:hypothetical protein